MKYDITVGGKHKATVTVDLDGQGAFTGLVESPDFGTGAISDGIQDGDRLKGKVNLEGYVADFTATISGPAITGSLSYGWFFNEVFTGSAAA